MIGSPGEAARARAVKIPQTTRTAASSDDAIDRAPVARAVVAGSIIAHLLARDSATSVLCPEAENAGYSQAPLQPHGVSRMAVAIASFVLGSPTFPLAFRN